MTTLLPHRISHTHQPSDSDAPATTYDFFPPNPPNYNNALPIAPSRNRSDAQLNLSVIQRLLPTTHSILRIAPFAVVYLFNPSREAWEKSGVEGSLFIVQTRTEAAEGYVVVILNRRGLENCTLRLEKADQVEVTAEYVILQDGATVYGLWIFEEADGSTQGIRAEIGHAMLECAHRAEVLGRNHAIANANGASIVPHEDAASSSPDLMALLGQLRARTVQPATAQQNPSTSQTQTLLDLLKTDERKARSGTAARRMPLAQDSRSGSQLLDLFRREPAPVARGVDRSHSQNLLELFRKS